MNTREEQFARMLRWYPRRWRETHGRVVLGTLLDEAEATGRWHPTRAERRAAVWEGLGHRLDRRFAMVTASAGAVLAIVATVAIFAFPTMLTGLAADPFASEDLPGLVRIVTASASVSLMVASLVATARTRGLPARTALWALLTGVLTGAALGAMQLSWTVGFDAADAGTAPSPLGSALPALILICVLLGGATVMLVAAPFLHRLSGAAWPVTLVAGTVVWIPTAYLLMNPPTTALCALGVLVIAAGRTPLGHAVPETVAPVDVSGRGRGALIALSTAAAVVGVAAIAFCLVGPLWTGLDATRAVQVGVGVGLLAACPLPVAAGVARARGRAVAHAWGPAVLWCAGLVVAACGNLFASVSDTGTIFVLLQIGAVPIGVGTGWWIATIPQASPGTLTLRRVAAVAAAAAVVILSPALQMLPFVAPVIAGIVAVRAQRSRRQPLPSLRRDTHP